MSTFSTPSTISMWMATTPSTSYPPLLGNLEVDVVIIGGGISGLSAAHSLTLAGASVALVEAGHIAAGVTGYTTAKITVQHNLIYSHLARSFSLEQARLYAEANRFALEEIVRLVEQHAIDCDLVRAPSYVFTTQENLVPKLEAEAEILRQIEMPVTLTTSTELPLPVAAALAVDNQAHFHPRKYLLAISQLLTAAGGRIFENTRALSVEDGSPCVVTTDRGRITAKHIIVATHQPFPWKGLYFTRLHQTRSYVLGAKLASNVPTGMYIQLEPSFYSFRPQPSPEGNLLLIGGEDHRAGCVQDSEERYRRLEEYARQHFDIASIPYHWSTQDNITLDEIPYIGPMTRFTKNTFVATGFNGWGMTHGVIAGRILCDQIMGRPNPWSDLYSPERCHPTVTAWPFVRENTLTAKEFVKGYCSIPPATPLEEIAPGEGKIVRRGLHSIGVFKDEQGQVHCVKPTCTHMKCGVEWNAAEKSWDCPCHGSRFNYDGKLIQGPATRDLPQVPVEDLKD